MSVSQQRMDFVDMTIESCKDCRDICTESIFHCIRVGGVLSQLDVLGVLMDCAEICKLSEHYMLRGSPYFRRMIPNVVEVCESTARMCDTIKDDVFLATTARSCRRCADNLKQVG